MKPIADTSADQPRKAAYSLVWNGLLLPDPDLIWDHSTSAEKLALGVAEFETYIRNNHDSIANYGERYRQGETTTTAFVESPINQVASRRFATRQQMHWMLRGAHLLLQTRTKVLNDELEEVFQGWTHCSESKQKRRDQWVSATGDLHLPAARSHQCTGCAILNPRF